MGFIERLLDLFRGKIELGGRVRSPDWRRVRREHIKRYPVCALTGSKRKLEVHHIEDFSTRPDLELFPANLITLKRDIHLVFGHLGSFRSINPNVREDVSLWKNKFENRR